MIRRQPGRRLDQDVHALAGHQAAEAGDQQRVRCHAEPASGGERARSRTGDGTGRCRRPEGRARRGGPGRRPAPPRPRGSRLRPPRCRRRSGRGRALGGHRASGRGWRPRRRAGPRRSGGRGRVRGARGAGRGRGAPARHRCARPPRAPRAGREALEGARRRRERITSKSWAASKASAPGCEAVKHRGRLRGEPAPELPQVGLDAPHLGREVVGDQQVPHAVRRDRRRLAGPGDHRRGRRRQLLDDLGCSIGQHVGPEQVVTTEPAGGPDGMAAQQRVGVAQVGGQRRRHSWVLGVGRVAQHHRARCAAGTGDRARGCTTGRAARAGRRRRPPAVRSSETPVRALAGPVAGDPRCSGGRPPGSRRTRRPGPRAAPGGGGESDPRPARSRPGSAGHRPHRAPRWRRWGRRRGIGYSSRSRRRPVPGRVAGGRR